MTLDQIEILTVNYNTPDLIEQLLETRDLFGYKNVHVKIIDGSDKIMFQRQLDVALEKYSNYTLDRTGYNIHHGPGLHKGIEDSTYPYILCLDSDSYFKAEGGIEYLMGLFSGDTYMVGHCCYVDNGGIATGNTYSAAYPYKYPHPSILLMDRAEYMGSEYKFIKHGAPLLEIAMGYHGQEDRLVHSPDIYNYMETMRRGTVKRFGYSLEPNAFSRF